MPRILDLRACEQRSELSNRPHAELLRFSSPKRGFFKWLLEQRSHHLPPPGSTGLLDATDLPALAVGAFSDDDGGNQRGAVWLVFLHPDGTVGSHAKISSTSGAFLGPLDDGDVVAFVKAAAGG